MIRSLFKKHHKFSFFRAAAVTTALAGLLSAGCVGDDEVEGSEVGDDAEDGATKGFSIKAYVKTPGNDEFRLIEYPPVDSQEARAALSRIEASRKRPQSAKGAGTDLRQKDQAFTYEVDGVPIQVNDESPWFLAWFAAEACREEFGSWFNAYPYPRPTLPSFHIWGTGAHTDYPQTCDDMLLQQQAMLCTAEKLAEMSEGLGPMTLTTGLGSTLSEVVIPPQSTGDRFILREQALIILAELARILELPPGTLDIPSTGDPQFVPYYQGEGGCSDAYAWLYEYPSAFPLSPQPGGFILGAYSDAEELGFDYPPATGTPPDAEIRELLVPRMRLLAHISRATFRLMRELVEAGVRGDLAGAEAATTLAQKWAMDPAINREGYNTYRHALRMILGSWPGLPYDAPYDDEFNWSDQQCNGYYNTRYEVGHLDLADAIPSLAIEVGLKTPQTAGQSLAWNLLRRAGLVVPNPDEGTVGDIQTALTQVLLAQAALEAGVATTDEYDTFVDSAAAKATMNAIGELLAADILFAARRGWQVYAGLVNAKTPEEISEPRPVLPAHSLATPWGGNEDQTVTAAGGFLVEGGIPEQDLQASLMGRFGPSARTCSPSTTDVFASVQKVLADMSTVPELAELVPPALDELETLTRSASTLQPTEFIQTSGGQYSVVLTADVSSINELIALYFKATFIQGSPMEAECIAGLRTRCDGVDAEAITVDQAAAPFSFDSDGRHFIGFFLVAPSGSTDPVWGILPPEGEKPGEIFMLGALDDGFESFTTWEVELLEAVQYGRTVKGADCAYSYDPSTFDYCLGGVERDMFVPVSNVLTGGDTDVDESWQHYLSLAADAAVKADQLANEILAQGFDEERRREDAQEVLSALCGGYPEEEDFSVEGSAAWNCLHEELIDMVYFGDLPDDLPESVRTDLLNTVCSASEEGLCDGLENATVSVSSEVTSETDITANAIGFQGISRSDDNGGTSWAADYCPTAFSDMTNLLTGTIEYDKHRYQQHINSGKLGVGDFAVAASRLRLVVDIAGDSWVVLNGETPVLGWVTWPGTGMDETSLGTPADGVFGAFPGCLHQPMNCNDGNGGCCSKSAKAIMDLIGGENIVQNAQASTRSWVEAAMWAIAYAGGYAPAGMFTVPLPAVISPPDPFAPATYYGVVEDVATVTIPLLDGREVVTNNAKALLEEGWLAISESDLAPFGNGFATSRSTNATFGAWLSSSSVGQRWVTQGRNPSLAITEAPERPQLFDSDLPSSYDGNGVFESLSSQLSCQRTGLPLMYGNNIMGIVWGAVRTDLCDTELPRGWFGPWDDPVRTFADVFPHPGRMALAGFGSPSWDLKRAWGDPANYGGFLLSPFNCGGPPNNIDPFEAMGDLESVGCFLGTDEFPRWDTPDCQAACVLNEEAAGASQTEALNACWSICVEDPCEGVPFSAAGLVLTECTPNDRTTLGLDTQLVEAVRVPMAVFLTCVGSGTAGLDVDVPPAAKSAADVALLRRWLASVSADLGERMARSFALGVPEEVVSYFKNGYVPQGLVGTGERGDQILGLAKAMQGIERGFRTVRSGVDALGSALGAAETQFEAVELASNKEMLGLALGRIDASRQVAQGVVSIAAGLATSMNFFGAIASGGGSVINGTAQAASGGIDVQFGEQKLVLYEDLKDIAVREELNQTVQVIQNLNDALLNAVQQMEEGIAQVSESQLAAYQFLSAIENRKTSVAAQLARLQGADFADIDEDGDMEAIPVNTVYRRQSDLLRERYERALATGKRYAYYARLAIEQRLGVRLSDLHDPVGPMQAPAQWVDKLCSLSGVDYKAFRTACTADNPECQVGVFQGLDEQELISKFADQYLGDYVAQLQEFVESYNIKFPFQDSEDIAVVSLRDHVLARTYCEEHHVNLLGSSGDLSVAPSEDYPGWTRSAWSTDLQMSVVPSVDAVASSAQSISAYQPLEPPTSPGGATDFIVSARPESELEGEEFELPPDPEFPNFVSQLVPLEAGASYELSWWDRARPYEGAVAEQPYRAVVLDPEESPLVLDVYSSEAVGDWSERRVVLFDVPESGEYQIGFQFLGEGASAIANVQLANLAQVSLSSAPYVHTDIRGRGRCDGISEDAFPDYFERGCDDDGCYYELRNGLSLREETILSAGFSTAGIPADNYNYRHLGVALNAVGTGLVDCDGQETSCFANAFLEYDLEHSAFQSRITNYGGEQQCFSFGTGAIRHGKMLAAERVMGIPMSSTDKELVAGEEFMKPVLKGRPLDGVYRLRIYDREGFNIEQLEDVQLVLKHVYWSRVERTPN